MNMSEQEILRSFKNSNRPGQQVRILAELNDTSEERITEILRKQGIDPRQLPRKTKSATLPSKSKGATPVNILATLKSEEARLAGRIKEINDYLATVDQELAALTTKLNCVQEAHAKLAEVYGSETK